VDKIIKYEDIHFFYLIYKLISKKSESTHTTYYSIIIKTILRNLKLMNENAGKIESG